MRDIFKRLCGSNDGNVAMIFAVAAIPLLTAVGAAVDYSRAGSLHSQLQADTDAAALAACKSPKTDRLELKAVAQNVLDGFMPGRVTILDPPIVAASNPRRIELTTQTSYSPQFMQFAGDITNSTTAS